MVEGTTPKTWGSSTRVFCDEHLQVEKLHIKEGGYSSIHLHEDKVNQFCVTLGTLVVKLFNDDNSEIDATVLNPGNTCCVRANVRHQFIAGSMVIGYEMYWSAEGLTVRPDDIIRFSTNGMRHIDKALPIDMSIQYAWCCNCNRQFDVCSMATVRVDNATRSMCLACVQDTESIPLTDEQ